MSRPSEIYETLSPTRLFFKYAVPNMISMAVISLYMIADGIFVGRFIGADALAAINLVMPFVNMSFVFSDMIAVGSAVQIAIHLGEKKELEASRIFTTCSVLIVAFSVLIGLAGFFAIGPILQLLGADAAVTALADSYVKVYALFAPLIMVFFAVDNYLRICGRTRYSMAVNVGTSLLNIAMDYLFLGVLHWGIGAAALSTCIGMTLGTFLSYAPFVRGKLPLGFVRGRISLRLMRNILFNGSSEFFTNIASSVMMLVFNGVLLYLAGAMAVAAFSVVMYVDSVVISLLYGMTDSMQPAISYSYGAGNRRRMLAFEKRVLLAGALIAAAAWAALRLGGGEILALFLKNEDPALIALSGQAMALFSFTYCTSWIGVCLSAFFTAVNRPAVSLLISLGRALLFPMAALAVLVRALGLEGVWLAPPVGNGLTALAAAVVFAVFLRRERARASAPEGREE